MSLLTPQVLEIINATAPAVAANIEKITQTFYPTMFKNNPEVLRFFNPSNQRTKRQPAALANAVLACVTHLGDLDKVSSALHLIAHKHCALNVKAADYKIVHDNFLKATAEVLGDAVTEEVAGAWSAVLMTLAGVLIEREQALYDAAAARVGGWRDARDFTVSKIVEEAPGIKSFHFAPVAGDVPEWSAGQYVSVASNPDAAAHKYHAPRHYTISSHNVLRITSKLHEQGSMSGWLHSLAEGDTVQLHAPYGEFVRRTDAARPVSVFVAGGIGITPCAAMAGEANAAGEKTALFHATHTGDAHPLAAELADCAVRKLGDRSLIAAVPAELAAAGIALDQCQFYICGPVDMMKAANDTLLAAGVPSAAIFTEAFGPKPDLAKK